MRTWMWLGLCLAGIAGVSPFVMQAQILVDHNCNICQQPVVSCNCVRTRPVVQTHMREEKVTTYRDVLETRYRQECIVEHTPVTTMEDRVETVWVPQQVTKKVARTVIVPQTKTRSVPYQVMQRIPETTTRMVPYQTVHHVTETVSTGCATTSPISHAWAPTPAMASVPTMPAITVPTPPTASSMPRPAPPLAPAATTKNSGGWQTIPARSTSASSNHRYGEYESDYDRPVPTPTDEPAIRRSSWRGGVPSAAAAWQRSYR